MLPTQAQEVAPAGGVGVNGGLGFGSTGIGVRRLGGIGQLATTTDLRVLAWNRGLPELGLWPPEGPVLARMPGAQRDTSRKFCAGQRL